MKHHLFVLLVLFSSSFSYAQTTSTDGSIKGIVYDSASKKSLDFVTVGVLDRKTKQLIKTTVSQPDGTFSISGLPFTELNLVLTFVGYRNTEISLPAFSSTSSHIDVGKVYLVSTTNQLEEVEVTAIRPIVKQEIDKVSYDVDADPESKTMNALDMLRKVPFITVDAEENIQLKGSSGFKVLVNGKTSSLFVRNPKDVFKSMPASSIKNIEVITNPPAKYDGEGIGGIINIITNRNTTDGFNGSIGAGASNPEGYHGYGYLTAKKGKFGISLNANNSLYTSPTNPSNVFREDYLFGTSLRQLGQSRYIGNWANIGGEATFEIDTLNLITLNYTQYTSKYRSIVKQRVEYTDLNNDFSQLYDRNNNTEGTWAGRDIGLDYQKTFKRNKEQLLTLSYKLNMGSSLGYTDFIINPISNFQYSESVTNNDEQSDEHTAQVDYVHPFKKFSVESGLKTIFRINKSDFYYKNYDETEDEYVLDPSQSNVFNYNQDIYAGYASLNYKKDKWGMKIGSRLEKTIVNANFKSSDTTAHQDYTNFIPSAIISRQLKGMSSIRLSYNQRIQRPGLWVLNPYVNRIDPKNISYGNPGLKAAVTNAIELGYSTFFKGSSINPTLYYNFTNNSIQQITTVNQEGVSETTYRNIGKNHSIGLSANSNISFSPKVNLNFNGNVSYVDFTSVINGKEKNNNGVVGSAYGGLTYSFIKTWRAGINLGYNSPRVGIQNTSSGYFFNSFSISKNIFKEKLSINASVSNPFQKNNNWKNEVKDENFYQSMESQWRMRSFNFSVNYRFGKLQGDIARKKRGIRNDDTNNSGGQGTVGSGPR